MKLILASNSPRRKEILQNAGYQFTVISSDYEESVFSSNPVETAVAFALGKAKSVFGALKDKSDLVVLGADTVVYSEGEILGKPDGEKEAIRMLKGLSGKTHSVITGYALITAAEEISGYCQTQVTFNDLTDGDIAAYVKSGLYKGKAGSYGIQDGYALVKSYDGSLSNVIGLPEEKVFPLLDKLLKD